MHSIWSCDSSDYINQNNPIHPNIMLLKHVCMGLDGEKRDGGRVSLDGESNKSKLCLMTLDACLTTITEKPNMDKIDFPYH